MFTIKSDHGLNKVGYDIIENDNNNEDDGSDEFNVEDCNGYDDDEIKEKDNSD